MVQFDGTYEFVSQDNYLEYLLSLGLPNEVAKPLADKKEKMVFRYIPGESVTATSGQTEITFPLNKQLEHKILSAYTVKTTASINGNAITFKTIINEAANLTEEKVFTFSDTELTSVTTNSKGVRATRKYKKV